ncbi:MAG TPA: serine/threonine-protein kinase [Polyangiaceae bacterium]
MTSEGVAKAGPSIFPGATISGRFRIEHLLGRGAMGAVWLARHLTLDVDVAVKFIDAAFRHEKDHRNRFVLEAKSAARINSPHVVSVLDFGEDGGRLYIAMEYLVGEDLGTWLERGHHLSLEVTARIVAHACRGLGKAHALGITHRDIKPENLFLCGDSDDEGFVLKILDFGVAKSIQRTPTASGTTAGQLIGSPAYMSPEQARGLPEIDGRSDLFSLAVVAYHCLTGTLPFNGDSIPELLFGIIGGNPEPASRRVPGLPRALDAWFVQALDKDPSKRFQTAKDMAQAFYMAIGRHASSSTDYTTVKAVAPAHINPVAKPPRPLAPTLAVKNSATTASSPRLSVSSASASTSNKTASSAVGPALAQLGDVPNVLGVGLVSPDMLAVAHHSVMGLTGATFGDVAQRARDALDTFESLEAGQGQALTLHFESASVFLRWIEDHVLVVVGTEQVHPTVLTVTLNTVATKLQSLAKQGGGAATVFRATLSGPKGDDPLHAATTITPLEELDQVNERVLSQLTQLFVKPLGAFGRLAIQQRLKAGKPTYKEYAHFVRKLALAIEDETARAAFVTDALALVPGAAEAAALTQSAAQSNAALHANAAAPPPLAGPPPLPAAAQGPSAPPAPAAAPVKKKRVIIYRGKRMEVDE